LRDGSGIAAVQTILRVSPVPHIFISGERLPVGCGGAEKLQKPFTYQDLVNAIARATGSMSELSPAIASDRHR
jgi:hypothetical protein